MRNNTRLLVFSLILCLLGLCSPIHADAGIHKFTIRNQVENVSANDSDKSFTFHGQFKTMDVRSSTDSDTCYPSCTFVYTNVTDYKQSITYEKFSADKQLNSTGELNLSAVGTVFVELKNGEYIEFYVEDPGNLYFFFFESYEKDYKTTVTYNGQSSDNPVALKTGETIGSALIGQMGTYYFSDRDSDFNEIYGPMPITVEGDMVIDYVNVPTVYSSNYQFVSSTPGQALPQEVLNLLPSGLANIRNATVVTAIYPAQTEVAVDAGTWHFDGYDSTTVTIERADVTFVGNWSFTFDTQPPIHLPIETPPTQRARIPHKRTGYCFTCCINRHKRRTFTLFFEGL